MLAGSVTEGAGLRDLTAYLAPPFAPRSFWFFYFFIYFLCFSYVCEKYKFIKKNYARQSYTLKCIERSNV